MLMSNRSRNKSSVENHTHFLLLKYWLPFNCVKKEIITMSTTHYEWYDLTWIRRYIIFVMKIARNFTLKLRFCFQKEFKSECTCQTAQGTKAQLKTIIIYCYWNTCSFFNCVKKEIIAMSATHYEWYDLRWIRRYIVFAFRSRRTPTQ